MIGPAGTFAAPRASDSNPWKVRTYSKAGVFYEQQGFATEEEARDIAAVRGTVRGQKGWTEEVHGPEGLVAVYRGGKEIKWRAKR